MNDRDEFAKAAITGVLCDNLWGTNPTAGIQVEKLAEAAYRIADAMIAESKKGKGKPEPTNNPPRPGQGGFG